MADISIMNRIDEYEFPCHKNCTRKVAHYMTIDYEKADEQQSFLLKGSFETLEDAIDSLEFLKIEDAIPNGRDYIVIYHSESS